MPFTKGHTIRVGQKNSPEQNQHIREAHLRRRELLGYTHTPESKKKLALARLGKKLSIETRAKMSESQKARALLRGSKRPKCVVCDKLLANYKASYCVEHKGKKGEQHYNWKGGRTEYSKAFRNSRQYAKWRKAVFERDNYICQICGIRGGKLNADHIKRFALYPELRLELSNGRTLCVDCHKETPTYGRRKVQHA